MLQQMSPKGGVLSETTQCILAQQLRNLKFGDHFWHENALACEQPMYSRSSLLSLN